MKSVKQKKIKEVINLIPTCLFRSSLILEIWIFFLPILAGFWPVALFFFVFLFKSVLWRFNVLGTCEAVSSTPETEASLTSQNLRKEAHYKVKKRSFLTHSCIHKKVFVKITIEYFYNEKKNAKWEWNIEGSFFMIWKKKERKQLW